MALRAAVIFSTTCFLLGALFTHWIADSLTLWKSGPVTDENLWTAALYYSILARAPSFVFFFLGTVVLVGGLSILSNLRDGAAGNLMFDGGSILLFGSTVAHYLYSVIPIMLSQFTALSTKKFETPFPNSLRTATLDLASTHLMCSVALTGVLVLQAAHVWADRSDAEAAAAELRRDADKQSASD
ncbi:Shr3 amino acid permease chaperone [Roridomyces roridus]|uniref:Shr3 amino acid permease chaperone n=1 Tax=Roridomyces roridus TaxID=1738132 RepID=A0AAD7FMA2_9AGAR|nr:Shr3 amino acid permease chaperone [Roridomyces roridus]